MDARSYAGVSEEEFATFVHTYRDLCSKTPRIYLFLFADTCAKAVLYSSWLESQLRRPFATLVLIAAGLPLLIYFVLTFCRLPPPVTPRTLRHLLLFAIAWNTAGTVVLSGVALIGWAHAGSIAARVTVPLFVSVTASLFVLPILLKHHNRLKQ